MGTGPADSASSLSRGTWTAETASVMGAPAWSSRGRVTTAIPPVGRGWEVLEGDGSLRGHIYFHLGDDSGFRAVRLDPRSKLTIT